jgi:hypothetical protein
MPLQGIGQWVESKFCIHGRAVPPESRGARRAHCGSCSRVAEIRPCIELEKKWETTGRVRKGVSRVTLTRDSLSAHPAREVAAVKAAWWRVSGKVSSMQIFGVFFRQDCMHQVYHRPKLHEPRASAASTRLVPQPGSSLWQPLPVVKMMTYSQS